MADRPLTTTSYAILGQLALRPWAAYELTKQMRRNVRFFWPRAESRIYDEVKRLVDHGLASAERTQNGRRARTTYSITDPGRLVLDAWLADPPARGSSLEFEALLRVFLANLSDPDALRSALEHAHEDALDLFEVAGPIGHEYVEGRAPFQDLVQYRALLYDFLASYGLTVADWADRSRATVDSWGEQSRAEREEQALATIRAKLDEVEARMPRARTLDH